LVLRAAQRPMSPPHGEFKWKGTLPLIISMRRIRPFSTSIDAPE
jgi:hypothetical protein